MKPVPAKYDEIERQFRELLGPAGEGRQMSWQDARGVFERLVHFGDSLEAQNMKVTVNLDLSFAIALPDPSAKETVH